MDAADRSAGGGWTPGYMLTARAPGGSKSVQPRSRLTSEAIEVVGTCHTHGCMSQHSLRLRDCGLYSADTHLGRFLDQTDTTTYVEECAEVAEARVDAPHTNVALHGPVARGPDRPVPRGGPLGHSPGSAQPRVPTVPCRPATLLLACH